MDSPASPSWHMPPTRLEATITDLNEFSELK
jgi:hypothetical protein